MKVLEKQGSIWGNEVRKVNGHRELRKSVGVN